MNQGSVVLCQQSSGGKQKHKIKQNGTTINLWHLLHPSLQPWSSGNSLFNKVALTFSTTFLILLYPSWNADLPTSSLSLRRCAYFLLQWENRSCNKGCFIYNQAASPPILSFFLPLKGDVHPPIWGYFLCLSSESLPLWLYHRETWATLPSQSPLCHICLSAIYPLTWRPASATAFSLSLLSSAVKCNFCWSLELYCFLLLLLYKFI